MRDRERSIANTGDLFRGSSNLALRPRLYHYEGFPLESIHRITRCRNTYKASSHLNSLDSLVPLLVPARTHGKPTSSPRLHLKHRVHTRTRNTANTLVRLLKEQRRSLRWSQHFDHLKTISQEHSYRMNMSMGCSSVCEKNKDGIGGGKLKKITFKHSW